MSDLSGWQGHPFVDTSITRLRTLPWKLIIVVIWTVLFIYATISAMHILHTVHDNALKRMHVQQRNVVQIPETAVYQLTNTIIMHTLLSLFAVVTVCT